MGTQIDDLARRLSELDVDGFAHFQYDRDEKPEARWTASIEPKDTGEGTLERRGESIEVAAVRVLVVMEGKE